MISRWRSPIHNPWKLRLVRGLFWTHFISSVLIPFYRDWGGLSFTQILLVNAWFMVWNFLLEVPTGTVADVWGRKASLVLGCAVGIVAALVYVSAPSLTRFLIAEVIFAASFTLMSGADDALLYDSLAATGRERDAQREYGRFAAAQQVGIVVGALFGSVIAARLGLRAPLLLQIVPMALGGLVALTLVEPAPLREERRPGYREVLIDGVRIFLTTSVVRLLALDMIVVGSLAWMIIWFYQPLLERSGVALFWFGAVHVGMSGGQILFLRSVDRLEAVLGSRRRLVLAGPLVVGVAYLALAWIRPIPLVVTLIVVASGFGLARAPLFSAYLNPHIGSARRATVLSTVAMFRTLAVAIVNPIAGWLADRSVELALIVLGSAALVAALLSRVREEHLVPPRALATDPDSSMPEGTQ